MNTGGGEKKSSLDGEQRGKTGGGEDFFDVKNRRGTEEKTQEHRRGELSRNRGRKREKKNAEYGGGQNRGPRGSLREK